MEHRTAAEDLILNLRAAGFTEGQLQDYLAVWEAGRPGRLSAHNSREARAGSAGFNPALNDRKELMG